MKSGFGKAHGKIILMGEHSVVYAQPAIALPFKQVTVTTTINESDVLSVDCIYHKGLLKDSPKQLENLQAVVEAVLLKLNKVDETFRIIIESTIPQERGMGSSAAVANATIAAIYDYFGVSLDAKTQFELAQISETIAHGNPSGLDAQVTVSAKPLYFIKDQIPETFDIMSRGYLVIADTGEKGQTRLAVASLQEKHKQNPGRVEAMIKGLGSLTNNTKEYLTTNNLEALGALMNTSQSYLREMGISNSTLDRLVSISVQSGALGAKLTGGGWGGCMLALTDNPQTAMKISETLMRSNARQTWLYSFAP